MAITHYIRKSGPNNTIRPFEPTQPSEQSISTEEQVAEALDHIAVVLSAIDSNIEQALALWQVRSSD